MKDFNLSLPFTGSFYYKPNNKRQTKTPSKSLKKTLLRQKDDKSTCMVLQINVVVVVVIVYVIKVTYIFVSVEGLRSNMKYINFFFRISM